jgi:hypothetical protein
MQHQDASHNDRFGIMLQYHTSMPIKLSPQNKQFVCMDA